MVAAILVIWSHQFALMGRPTPLVFNNEPGALGVVMFFAISGYLVTQSWVADASVRRFMLRRALRIWPGLAVVVLMSVFILGPLLTDLPLTEYFRHPVTHQHLLNLVLKVHTALPGVFISNPHPGSVNGPLWTIPLEVGCYATLVMLGLFRLVRWRWSVLFVFVFLAAILQWRYRAEPFPEWCFALQYGIIFALGAALSRWNFLWRSYPWVTAALILAASSLLYRFGPSPLNGQGPLFALAGLAVVFGSCCTAGVSQAGRLGDFSYGLYIYGFPVQQTIIWFTDNQLSFPVALGLSIIFTLFLAVFSWHLVEKPALRWKPRRP